MVYRMAEYKAILQRKYKIPVQQFVIYLGTKKSRMRTSLPSLQKINGFKIKSIMELPTGEALNSKIPEEIILAILTDYPEADTSHIIAQIIQKLQQAATNESQLNHAIQQVSFTRSYLS